MQGEFWLWLYVSMVTTQWWQYSARFAYFPSSANILRVKMEESKICAKSRGYGESINSLFVLLFFNLCKSKLNYIKKGTENKAKHVYTKDFFKLKFIGKKHLIHFLWWATTVVYKKVSRISRMYLVSNIEFVTLVNQ